MFRNVFIYLYNHLVHEKANHDGIINEIKNSSKKNPIRRKKSELNFSLNKTAWSEWASSFLILFLKTDHQFNTSV